MSEAKERVDEARPARAAFWLRAIALGVDLLVVNLIVAAIGLIAVPVTGGTVRVGAATVFNRVDCVRVERLPSGHEELRGVALGDVRQCKWSVLGFAHDWSLVVRETAQAGETLRSHQVRIPVDPAGNPRGAFYLDSLVPLVLALYLLAFELRTGTTPGKRLAGVRVRTLADGRLDLAASLKRTLPKLLPFLAAGAPDSVDFSAATTYRMGLALNLSPGAGEPPAWAHLLDVLAAVYVVAFVVATIRGALPPHDWWAGTEAVRAAPRHRSNSGDMTA